MGLGLVFCFLVLSCLSEVWCGVLLCSVVLPAFVVKCVFFDDQRCDQNGTLEPNANSSATITGCKLPKVTFKGASTCNRGLTDIYIYIYILIYIYIYIRFQYL